MTQCKDNSNRDNSAEYKNNTRYVTYNNEAYIYIYI